MPADSSDIPSLKKCPFCGNQIKKSAYRCPFCHESLAELDQREWNEVTSASESEESEEAAPSDIREDSLSSLSMALIAAAVVILVIFISYQLFSVRKRGDANNLSEILNEPSPQKKAARIQKPDKLKHVEPAPADTSNPPNVPAEAGAEAVATAGPPTRGPALPDAGIVGAEFELQIFVPGRPDMTKAFIKSKLGEPDLEHARILDYNLKYGIELVMAQQKDVLEQIQINSDRFKGHLSSGISLSSRMQEVFDAYGEPSGRELADDLLSDSTQFKDAILYESGRFSRISYRKMGLAFWFHRERVIQIGIGEAG